MTGPIRVSRRQALKVGAAAAALPLVHIRTAGAAGKLSVGFWDHWVPTGNGVMKKQVDAWAEKNKVDVTSDFITSVGNKNLLTIAAEAQAKTGHDIQAFPTWEVHNNQDNLEPMDDVMKRLTDKYGKVNDVCDYLAKIKGHWLAVPTSSGTQVKGPCARISVLKQAGMDVTEMFPAKSGAMPGVDSWTWDALLKVAGPAQKAGLPFAFGLGTTTDSVDWVGALFRSFGADLVDAKGNITVKGNAKVRQVLEYCKQLVPLLPNDVVSYDDASNNRALISGKSAMIFNPPSAYAVAKRDNPDVAKDCWTFTSPAGAAGRFIPYLPYLWGVWKFSQNKTAAKELIEYLMQREQVEERDNIVDGYDLPPYVGMTDFKVWETVGPPQGTVFNYPIRPEHKATASIALYPAPPEIAVQAYNQGTQTIMIAKATLGGQSIDAAIDWAQNELEGFAR